MLCVIFLPRFRAHKSADIEHEHSKRALIKSLDPEKEDLKTVFRVRDDIFWRGIREEQNREGEKKTRSKYINKKRKQTHRMISGRKAWVSFWSPTKKQLPSEHFFSFVLSPTPPFPFLSFGMFFFGRRVYYYKKN